MVCMIYYVDFAFVGVNGRRIYNSEGYSVRCVMHGECDCVMSDVWLLSQLQARANF